MSSERSNSCAVHHVMDAITVVVYAYLVFTVNITNAWLRPYDIDTRFLRRHVRFSRRPAVWRVVPLGMEKKRMPQPSSSEVDAKFSLPDKDNTIDDQELSASENGHSHGRVLIKVFRGPEDEHHFARHGFFIKHPEDD